MTALATSLAAAVLLAPGAPRIRAAWSRPRRRLAMMAAQLRRTPCSSAATERRRNPCPWQASMGALPAMPLARMETMSLVEVSPSTAEHVEGIGRHGGQTTRLSSHVERDGRSRWSGSTSMVAMLGAIMPAALGACRPACAGLAAQRGRRTATSLRDGVGGHDGLGRRRGMPPAGVSSSESASLPKFFRIGLQRHAAGR